MQSKKTNQLYKLMYPKSIAVIGASNRASSVGNEIILRLKEMKFAGNIYPINLKESKIEGIKAYKNVTDVKKEIDLAVIAVPAQIVLNVINECHASGIESVVVITSGFKEIGGEGASLEKQLLEKIKKYKMLMVGPNCLGVINTDNAVCMNASFAPLSPVPGKIGFASQSGAIGSGIINILPETGIGLGQFVSLGNGADINALDMIAFWENDPNINLIMLYLESIPSGAEFKKLALRVSKQKPILIVKSGRSSAGAKAASSHTGSLAGDDVSTTALLASSGVIRELYLRDMFVSAQALSKLNVPTGERMAIITNAGGPGILTADGAEDLGIPLASLSDQTKSKLRKILPPQASINNPLDVVASATFDQIQKSAKILLSSEEVDILMVIYLYITGQNDVPLTLALEKLQKQHPNKPIVAFYMTSEDFNARLSAEKAKQSDGKMTSLGSNIPIYNSEINALHAIKRLIERKRFLQDKNIKKPKLDVDFEKAKNIIDKCKAQNIKTISTLDSLDIFKAYGLNVVKYGAFKTFSEAKRLAKNIGYPVSIKISSDTISHKTDIGGVITGIENEKMLKHEFNDLQNRLKEKGVLNEINNFIVMENVKGSGRELVLGVASKPNIGRLAMFGIGGVFIEALKEVAFRPLPLTLSDARALINQTKAKALMGSVRGYGAANMAEFEELFLRVSKLCEDFPEITELDANPIMLDKQGNAYLVDARIVVEEK